MINDQLLIYIKQQLSLNISRETIVANLKGAGWNDADITDAFIAINPIPASSIAGVVPATSTLAPNMPQPERPLATHPATQSTFNPTVNSFTHQPVVNNKRSKGRKIFFAVIVLVLIGLASGGVYAYYAGVFVTLPSLTSAAFDNARKTTSESYDTTVNIDFSGIKDMASSLSQLLPGGINSDQISFTSKGSYDISDPQNFKSSSVISLSMGSLSLAAEFRILNNTIYGTLTKAPTIAFFPMLSSYENEWFSFPYKSENGQITGNPLTAVSPVDPNITSKLSQEQKDYIYKMSRDAHFIKTVQRLSPETVGGEPSYHFSFDLDRAGISSYLQSLKVYVNTIGKDDSALSAFDPTSFAKDLDKIKDFQGEIWIGRNDKLLHKIILNFGVQPDLAKDEQAKFDIVGILSNWNQPVSITAPAESTSFETFISGLMNDSLGAAREKGQEAAIKANLSNMRAQAEIFYNDANIYSGFCLSKELKAARTTIEAAGGTAFVCKDAPQTYAIGVKISQNSGYWCVDSTGASKSTATLPTGTICPVK